MIAALREWLLAVVTVTLLLSVAQTIIPEGSIRKISSFTGGLILLAVLLQPVLSTDIGRLRLDFSDYTDAIEERQEELESAQEEEMAAIIAEKTQAYILDKADALGLELTVRVQTQPGEDGVPCPAAVEVDGPRSEELAAYMEQELGIPEERQVWNGQEDES